MKQKKIKQRPRSKKSASGALKLRSKFRKHNSRHHSKTAETHATNQSISESTKDGANIPPLSKVDREFQEQEQNLKHI